MVRCDVIIISLATILKDGWRDGKGKRQKFVRLKRERETEREDSCCARRILNPELKKESGVDG
jgi:hypothetical protein